jgi:Pyruvate/2-oxoacid:ferredoxin oxidoreductase delta subunit
MNSNDRFYIRLQRHLDRQPIGFPATRSGVEIRLLKHIFTPREAAIACCLSYRFEPLGTVFARAGREVASPEELEAILGRIEAKGGIESRTRDGEKHYRNAPFVVGFYEFQVGRLTPGFVRDFNAYTSTLKFGVEFLSTELPQMRTIPVSRSLQPRHRVSTYDEAAALLEAAAGPFVIIECICRKKKAMEGTPCRVTGRRETCLAIGDMARPLLESRIGREIPREEALAVLAHNQQEGLVLQPSNTRQADFICSCCGCCCGMLGMHRLLPRPLDFWASNFQARVDADACTACGVCARRCQVGAVAVTKKKPPARVDLNRCIGCGVCVTSCSTGAMSLRRKDAETVPPETREELYDIIMAHKKGRLGKLKLTAKLVADTVLTRQVYLLKAPFR